MTSHRLPFENRWTNGEHAWQWSCELERLGPSTVRVMFADHETNHPARHHITSDIPAGFARDWLAFHDRRIARRQLVWHSAVIGLGCVAAIAAVIGALRP
jgi:hypothetical protein